MHVNPVHIPPDLRIASAAFLTACSDHEAKLLMWYFLQLVLNYTEEQAAFETKTVYVFYTIIAPYRVTPVITLPESHVGAVTGMLSKKL